MLISIPATPAEQRVILGNVPWELYVALTQQSINPRGRMAYDHGVLEIMSPSYRHENISCLIGRMIEMFTWQRQIDIHSSRSTTFKREIKQKGFEADVSYYLSHAADIQGIDEVELEIHPPPDLAIEVDISRSSQIKMRVYAGLGVREVWRYDGEQLTVQLLTGDKYEPSPTSRELPDFPVGLVNELLAQREQLSENQLINRFVDNLKKV